MGCPLASHEPISDFPNAVSQQKSRTAGTRGGAGPGSELPPAAIQCSMRSTLHPQHGLLQPGSVQLISMCRQCRVGLLSPRRLGGVRWLRVELHFSQSFCSAHLLLGVQRCAGGEGGAFVEPQHGLGWKNLKDRLVPAPAVRTAHHCPGPRPWPWAPPGMGHPHLWAAVPGLHCPSE